MCLPSKRAENEGRIAGERVCIETDILVVDEEDTSRAFKEQEGEILIQFKITTKSKINNLNSHNDQKRPTASLICSKVTHYQRGFITGGEKLSNNRISNLKKKHAFALVTRQYLTATDGLIIECCGKYL